ncbi:MAG: helix-turn-helix domain-containing protein [Methylocystis sp.]
MARRYDLRRVKIHRSYTIPEAARLLDAHKQTVLRWISHGLEPIERKRPFLIHGSDLRAYLQNKHPPKQPCRVGEIYCVRCRERKRPAGAMAEYIPQNGVKGRLRGICPTCDRLIQRFVSLAKIDAVRGDLDVSFQAPQQRLADSPQPAPNVTFGRKPK